MTIERDADDVARCFALQRELYEGGAQQAFAGEVVGLISAGAFVAFPRELGLYEGMLPVRRLREASAERDAGSEWWEINELGTILRRRAHRRDASPRRSDRRARGRASTRPRPRRPRARP